MDKTAVDFVNDVRSGMTDEDLQKKYRIFGQNFTFHKAAALDFIAKDRIQRNPKRRQIKAQEFLKDVKAGMGDDALMAKYLLTHRGLQSALRQLIKLGLATPLELSNRLSITTSQIREAFVEMGKAIKELD
jgi:hypothetical protein